LPDERAGSLEALRVLIDAAEVAATRSGCPRFFHVVMGGGTPAALAADWLTSALDQIAFSWVSSPFAKRLEQISVGWLKELFGLPAATPTAASPRRANDGVADGMSFDGSSTRVVCPSQPRRPGA
jgi:glutamate/tyrosine decarboxylase-like PLP-dependent enzyme